MGIKVFLNEKTGEIAYGKTPPGPDYIYVAEPSYNAKPFSAYCPEHKRYELCWVAKWARGFIRYCDEKRLRWVERWGCSVALTLYKFAMYMYSTKDAVKIFPDEIEFYLAVERMAAEHGERFVGTAENAANLLKLLDHPDRAQLRRKVLKSIAKGDMDGLSRVVCEATLKHLTKT